MKTEEQTARALEAELEAALCAPNWAASLGHVHNAKAALVTLRPEPAADDGLVEEIRASLGPKFKHLAPHVAEAYREDVAALRDNGNG